MRRQDDVETGAAAGTTATAPAAHAVPHGPARTVADWNATALAALRTARLDAAAALQTLAALHTCLYNAWAAYDDAARQTVHGMALRLPCSARDPASQAAAMHHAARVLLAALLPGQRALFDARLAACGLVLGGAAQPFSPAGIGQAQALAMLDAGAGIPFAALPGGIGAVPGTPDEATLARCWAHARRLSDAGGNRDDRDVLLYLVLAHALVDAGGAGASAATEVLRRFGVTRRDLVQGEVDALGREIGARVYDKARRYWLGKL